MATREQIEAAAAEPLAFFPHDADAAHDMKLEALIDETGMDGYGRWWLLCEMLASETGHKLEVGNDRIAKVMARRMKLSVPDMVRYLSVLSDIGLVEMSGDGYVWSRRMMENALYKGEKRANGRMGGRPRKTEKTS